jgi:hypothetical protein
MGSESQYNRGFAHLVCSIDQLAQNLAVTAMDAVKDADGQPGILKG